MLDIQGTQIQPDHSEAFSYKKLNYNRNHFLDFTLFRLTLRQYSLSLVPMI